MTLGNTSRVLFESVKKQIQTLLRQRKPVIINPNDVTESHVKGSGPGGQAVNKTSNAVCLFHRPTGIQVRSHKTRYLEMNRRDAWKLLEWELDQYINGPCSQDAINSLKKREQKRINGRKSRHKHDRVGENGNDGIKDGGDINKK